MVNVVVVDVDDVAAAAVFYFLLFFFSSMISLWEKVVSSVENREKKKEIEKIKSKK